jgi:hypothetical protein
MLVELSKDFSNAKYVLEEVNEIAPSASLNGFSKNVMDLKVNHQGYVGWVCLYNPDMWKYSMFYFYQSPPEGKADFYRILHISQ